MSAPSAFKHWGPHRKRRQRRGAPGRPGSKSEGKAAGWLAREPGRSCPRVNSRIGMPGYSKASAFAARLHYGGERYGEHEATGKTWYRLAKQ